MSEPKQGQSRGNAGKGRRLGSVNKTTAALKDAILKAAELTGNDGKGKDGLIGYLRRVAEQDVKAMAGLLGKVLPLQVTGDGENPIRIAGEIILRGIRPDGRTQDPR